jgi:hypothetical protein
VASRNKFFSRIFLSVFFVWEPVGKILYIISCMGQAEPQNARKIRVYWLSSPPQKQFFSGPGEEAKI